MLYKEIIAVYFEIHTKHINTQSVELLNVRPCGTYSNHWSCMYVYIGFRTFFYVVRHL